ncbi:Alpha/Beta hydrolase protein [Crassisporium funariophilum]|nr:Alpha/Beta hydrolase protein [Crassisporium funariophilum]
MSPLQKVTLSGKVRIVINLVPLCVVVPWRLLLSFVTDEKQKTWRRVVFDAGFRWVAHSQTIPHIAHLIGPTTNTYKAWVKQNALEACIEEIAEDARLLWIGEKRTTKVILYIHGGGYSMPLCDFTASFWKHLQGELKQKAQLDIGVVMLDYSLVSNVHFPVPLRQTISAIKHLIANGTQASDIHLAGDSAGANLALQLLLHMLHPIPGLPSLPTSIKFGGLYMMSPWVNLIPRSQARSYSENDARDIVSTETLEDFGQRVLAGVEEDSFLPYLDTYFAPIGWYDGIGKTVDRVLITAGGAECLRDDIVEFSETFRKSHRETKVVVDKFGVHDDPMYDFLAGETKLCELTPIIIQWYMDAFSVAI